ncbi:hypothetical protein P167DRAFT_424249 [Morchella conica CCBAS932]|uniref:Uncharacterized protein n=1 Tax=Morchella conica CCBAS932 TaxID=1392247 RepID=A0A3N4K9F5_9PEZI|nr:hypothetical protein P167DRAFT_424249 [Morchella conica CCBAS932]
MRDFLQTPTDCVSLRIRNYSRRFPSAQINQRSLGNMFKLPLLLCRSTALHTFKVFALCLVRNIWQYGVGCAAESLISDTSRRALTSAVTRTHNRGREQASCSPRNVFSATLPSLTARYRLLAGVGGRLWENTNRVGRRKWTTKKLGELRT